MPPKGSESCKVYFYDFDHFEGEGESLGPPLEALGLCAVVHDPPTRARSVKVVR